MPLYKGNRAQFGRRACPYCLAEFLEAEAVSDEVELRAGVVGVCGTCGEIWIMDEDTSLRRVTPGELFAMYATCPDADVLERLQRQVRDMNRAKQAGSLRPHVRSNVASDFNPQTPGNDSRTV